MRGLGFGISADVGEEGEVGVVGDLLGKRDGGRGKVRVIVVLDMAGFEVDVLKGRRPDGGYDTPGTGTGGLSSPPPR